MDGVLETDFNVSLSSLGAKESNEIRVSIPNAGVRLRGIKSDSARATLDKGVSLFICHLYARNCLIYYSRRNLF